MGHSNVAKNRRGVALTIVSLFVMGGVASATTLAPSPSSPANATTINIQIGTLAANFSFTNSMIVLNGGSFVAIG